MIGMEDWITVRDLKKRNPALAYGRSLSSWTSLATVNGPVILGRSIMMLQGSYHITNIKALGKSVCTNNSFGGSGRGAGWAYRSVPRLRSF